jgi:hypothetical protein
MEIKPRKKRRPYHRTLKTHCLRGHAYTGTNVFYTKDGRQQCSACRVIWGRRGYLALKAKGMKRVDTDKKRARSKIQYEVRVGRIVPSPCEICGNERVQAHHNDYTKPLEVRWLCKEHHTLIHFPNLPALGNRHLKQHANGH